MPNLCQNKKSINAVVATSVCISVVVVVAVGLIPISFFRYFFRSLSAVVCATSVANCSAVSGFCSATGLFGGAVSFVYFGVCRCGCRCGCFGGGNGGGGVGAKIIGNVGVICGGGFGSVGCPQTVYYYFTVSIVS